MDEAITIDERLEWKRKLDDYVQKTMNRIQDLSLQDQSIAQDSEVTKDRKLKLIRVLVSQIEVLPESVSIRVQDWIRDLIDSTKDAGERDLIIQALTDAITHPDRVNYSRRRELINIFQRHLQWP